MKILKLIGSITIAVVVSSCSSAIHQIADEELTTEQPGNIYTNLLVVGAYNDRPYRIGAETLFAEVIKSKGVNASPSYDLLPQLDSLISNEEAVRKLKETNYDGVIVVATIDEGYDYDLGDYYGTKGMFSLLGVRTGRYYEMGSFIEWAGSGLYTLYVGLYDINSPNPVWKITTDSQTTGSESEDNKALAELIINRLREKGLIKQIPKTN